MKNVRFLGSLKLPLHIFQRAFHIAQIPIHHMRVNLTNMKLHRFLAYLLGGVILISMFCFHHMYVYWLGFPDGGLTQLESAEKVLFKRFIWVSVATSGYFLYLGWISSRKNVEKKLFFSFLIYLAFIIFIGFIDYYYRLNLDNGLGG